MGYGKWKKPVFIELKKKLYGERGDIDQKKLSQARLALMLSAFQENRASEPALVLLMDLVSNTCAVFVLEDGSIIHNFYHVPVGCALRAVQVFLKDSD